MNLYDDVINKYKRKNQILFSRDSLCLQPLLELMRKHKHRILVLWAFKCIDRIAIELNTKYPNELTPKIAIDLCKSWAQGDVLMPVAKKALLEVHHIAKETDDLVDIALFHAIGQGCAVVHVETHAIGIAIYELTAIVRKYGIDNFSEAVQSKINQYINDLYLCEQEIKGTNFKWAKFLLNDEVPNKEQLLYLKKLK